MSKPSRIEISKSNYSSSPKTEKRKLQNAMHDNRDRKVVERFQIKVEHFFPTIFTLLSLLITWPTSILERLSTSPREEQEEGQGSKMLRLKLRIPKSIT